MATARFEIRFTGTAVESGAIDVKDLAPTLLSIGKLIEESNRVLNEDRASASVRVRAEFQPGSFEGVLELAISFFDKAKHLFAEGRLHDAREILETIGFYGGVPSTLYLVIRQIGKRKPKSATILQTGKVSIELEDGEEDGEKVETSKAVAELYNDIKVLQAARDIAKPVEREGLDAIQFGPKGKTPTTEITKTDLPVMDSWTLETEEVETLHKGTSERVLGVVRPSFSGDYKWTLLDGDKPVPAAMEDQSFVNKVETGEIGFASMSLIKAEVEITATRSKTGKLGSRYRVLKVIGVIPPPKQTRFDFKNEGE